jgi:hypothetical protein
MQLTFRVNDSWCGWLNYSGNHCKNYSSIRHHTTLEEEEAVVGHLPHNGVGIFTDKRIFVPPANKATHGLPRGKAVC